MFNYVVASMHDFGYKRGGSFCQLKKKRLVAYVCWPEPRVGAGRVGVGAMAVAERVAREIMGCCTQRHLLACRRSLPLEPMRSTRKTDLINDLVALCECPSRRHSIFSHLLASWQVQVLRVFIARLRALGCMIEIGPAHRQQDLVAAIINTQEYAPSRLGRSRGVCPSPRPAESKGLSAHHCAPPSPREEPASSTPAGTTALVAFDSAADPVKMGRKLARGWAKRWLKFCKKKERKTKTEEMVTNPAGHRSLWS